MTTAKRILLSLLSFILIVVSVCPLFAFADEVPSYNIPFSQPQVTEDSGYIEVLFERPSDGYRYIRLFQWQTTVASDWTELDIPVPLFLTINKNGYIQFKFEANPESIYYSVISIYDSRLQTDGHFNVWQNLSDEGIVNRYLDYDDNVVSFNIYGSYAQLSSNMTDSYLPKFTVTYGSDTSMTDIFNRLVDISEKLLQLHNDNVLLRSDLEYISGQLNSFYEQMKSDFDLANKNIYNIANYLYTIISQLNAFSDRIHSDLISVYTALDFLLQDFRSIMPYYEWIDQDLLEILDRLDRLLEMQGNVEQTTVDNSNIDNALDIENSLLDNSNVDVSDVVNVEVNQNALTVIWDLVEKFLNSNGKVFGMVLTVLSLGLVAMILGRKV